MAYPDIPLRLSPSGPPLENDNGGDGIPGSGFQLRFVDNAVSTAAVVLSGTMAPLTESGPTPFSLALSAPSPNRKYVFEYSTTLSQTSNVSAQWRLACSYSYDGTNWDILSSGQWFTVFQRGSADLGSIQVYFRQLLTLGSALPGGGVPANPIPANLFARPEAAVSTGTGIVAGTHMYARLTEYI